MIFVWFIIAVALASAVTWVASLQLPFGWLRHRYLQVIFLGTFFAVLAAGWAWG